MQRGSKDSYMDLACNLRTAFQQWLKGLSVSTFKALQELMIKDQFLYNCPTEVRQFVLDREPKTADQAAEIADCFEANRMPDPWRTTAPSGKGGKPAGSFFQDRQRTTTPSWRGGKPAEPSSPERQRTRAPGLPRPKSPVVDTRRCYSCSKVGHLSISCPEKKSAPTNPSSSPLVLCASRDARGLLHNLQPVTVGDTITTGLRDTGAEVTLVRPELVGPENIIWGKIMTVKGVGGINPAVPMACVYLDWGAGRGIREVGVTDAIPTNVILGTDLGRLVAQYESDSEGGRGMMDCVSGPSPSRSPKVKPTAVEIRKCFICHQVGHLMGHCPELRKPSLTTSAKSASPAVLHVGEKVGGRADNLQPVAVGNNVKVGLRDTGSKHVLGRPGRKSLEDVIPEEAKVITGVGGVNPALPVACVALSVESLSHVGEVGISDPTDEGVCVGNLQPVTTDINGSVGLQGMGSEEILACPELASCEEVIPAEVMAVTGFVLPVVCASVPQEYGGKMMEVGIADPTNVLMDTDTGKRVAQKELNLTPLQVTSLPESPDSAIVLFKDSVHTKVSGEGIDNKDCVPGPGPSGSPELRSEVELDVMDSRAKNVLCVALQNDMCSADTPSAMVEPLLTVTEELSTKGTDQTRSDLSEPGPEGLKSFPPLISLVSVADSSEFLEAVQSDGGLKEPRGLTDGTSVENDRARMYGTQSCDSAIVFDELKCGAGVLFGKGNCVSGESGKDKQCIPVSSHGMKSSVAFSSVPTVMNTAIVDSLLCATEKELPGGSDLIQFKSTLSAEATCPNDLRPAVTVAASPQEVRCDGPSAEDRIDVREKCHRMKALRSMPVTKLTASWERPYTRPKHLDAVADTVPPDRQGQWLRMMTAHNDRFARILPECSLWPGDEVDPQGDLLANSDPDPLGSVGEGCGDPLLSAREQADMSVLKFQVEPLPLKQAKPIVTRRCAV